MPPWFSPLFFLFARSSEGQLRRYILFLKAELEMTRARVPQSRIFLTSEERQRLLELGDGIGSDVLKLVSIVHPRTYRRWLERRSQGKPPAKKMTMQYFGCNDLATAERISRRLGRCTTADRRGWDRQGGGRREVDLVTPAEVMQELRSPSNIQYVFPSSTLPMRLERVAFKPLRTPDGGRFLGLPLKGHYDEDLE